MGACNCAGGSQLEQFLTDFVEDLRVRKMSDKALFDLFDKHHPFALGGNKLISDSALKESNHHDEHEKYRQIQLNRQVHYLCVCLLFLSKCENKGLSTAFLTLIEKLKNKHIELNKTRLEDFYKTDYEVLQNCVREYCRFVSLDVVEACSSVMSPKFNLEQAHQLKSIYGTAVVDTYVSELFLNTDKNNVDHHDFFKRNETPLKHWVVREKLRNIFNSKFSHLGNTPRVVQSAQPNKPIVQAVQPIAPVLPAQKIVTPNPAINPPVSTANITQSGYRPNKTIDLTAPIYQNNPAIVDYKPVAMPNQAPNLVSRSNPYVTPIVAPIVPPTKIETRISDLVAPSTGVRLNQLEHFRKNCLDAHNEKRSLHNSDTLEEDLELTEFAQTWANNLADTDTLVHSSGVFKGKQLGENIAKGSAVLDDPARLICGKWYEEKDNYDFSTPGSQSNTKNFTQMIWKNTQKVGFGLAYSKSGNTYVVVNYYPAGNVSDKYEDNVLDVSGVKRGVENAVFDSLHAAKKN